MVRLPLVNKDTRVFRDEVSIERRVFRGTVKEKHILCLQSIVGLILIGLVVLSKTAAQRAVPSATFILMHRIRNPCKWI